MVGGGGAGNARELDQTPTWAVASVCAVIILISIILEKVLHRIGEWLTKKRKKALFEALEKVKAELMVLGFISLLLTFGQNYISKICISEKVADTMLPCRLEEKIEAQSGGENHHRRLLWDRFLVYLTTKHRFLSEAGDDSPCPTGKVSLISVDGLHQLHIFIFFLAVFHVAYSAITMLLGRVKIRGWKEWEGETSSLDYEFSCDPSRFRFTHETSFVRQHTSFWNRIPFLFYIVSFFHQFFRSVRKTDYLAMRHGFINVHLAPGSKFDFQKYIKRSLEDDFKVVVGISPLLWASAVIFLLVNVKGWQTMFWISIIPLIIILAVGTKLQAIITRMALEIKERHNAFQIIYFLWTWYEFGLESCFHDNFKLIIARISLSVAVQILCSYVTLPLYALVSQMGSNMKKSMFDEQASKALKKWHQAAKEKQGKPAHSPSRTPGTSPGASPSASPVHPLHRFQTTGHLVTTKSPSRRRNHSDHDLLDVEADIPAIRTSVALIPNMMQNGAETRSTEQSNAVDDFTFAKPDKTYAR